MGDNNSGGKNRGPDLGGQQNNKQKKEPLIKIQPDEKEKQLKSSVGKGFFDYYDEIKETKEEKPKTNPKKTPPKDKKKSGGEHRSAQKASKAGEIPLAERHHPGKKKKAPGSGLNDIISSSEGKKNRRPTGRTLADTIASIAGDGTKAKPTPKGDSKVRTKIGHTVKKVFKVKEIITPSRRSDDAGVSTAVRRAQKIVDKNKKRLEERRTDILGGHTAAKTGTTTKKKPRETGPLGLKGITPSKEKKEKKKYFRRSLAETFASISSDTPKTKTKKTGESRIRTAPQTGRSAAGGGHRAVQKAKKVVAGYVATRHHKEPTRGSGAQTDHTAKKVLKVKEIITPSRRSDDAGVSTAVRRAQRIVHENQKRLDQRRAGIKGDPAAPKPGAAPKTKARETGPLGLKGISPAPRKEEAQKVVASRSKTGVPSESRIRTAPQTGRSAAGGGHRAVQKAKKVVAGYVATRHHKDPARITDAVSRAETKQYREEIKERREGAKGLTTKDVEKRTGKKYLIRGLSIQSSRSVAEKLRSTREQSTKWIKARLRRLSIDKPSGKKKLGIVDKKPKYDRTATLYHKVPEETTPDFTTRVVREKSSPGQPASGQGKTGKRSGQQEYTADNVKKPKVRSAAQDRQVRNTKATSVRAKKVVEGYTKFYRLRTWHDEYNKQQEEKRQKSKNEKEKRAERAEVRKDNYEYNHRRKNDYDTSSEEFNSRRRSDGDDSRKSSHKNGDDSRKSSHKSSDDSRKSSHKSSDDSRKSSYKTDDDSHKSSRKSSHKSSSSTFETRVDINDIERWHKKPSRKLRRWSTRAFRYTRFMVKAGYLSALYLRDRIYDDIDDDDVGPAGFRELQLKKEAVSDLAEAFKNAKEPWEAGFVTRRTRFLTRRLAGLYGKEFHIRQRTLIPEWKKTLNLPRFGIDKTITFKGRRYRILRRLGGPMELSCKGFRIGGPTSLKSIFNKEFGVRRQICITKTFTINGRTFRFSRTYTLGKKFTIAGTLSFSAKYAYYEAKAAGKLLLTSYDSDGVTDIGFSSVADMHYRYTEGKKWLRNAKLGAKYTWRSAKAAPGAARTMIRTARPLARAGYYAVTNPVGAARAVSFRARAMLRQATHLPGALRAFAKRLPGRLAMLLKAGLRYVVGLAVKFLAAVAGKFVLFFVVALLLKVMLVIISGAALSGFVTNFYAADEEDVLEYQYFIQQLDEEFRQSLEQYYDEPYDQVYIVYQNGSGVYTDWQDVLALVTVLTEQEIENLEDNEELIREIHERLNYVELEEDTTTVTNEDGSSSEQSVLYVNVYSLPVEDIVSEYLTEDWQIEWYERLSELDLREQYPNLVRWDEGQPVTIPDNFNQSDNPFATDFGDMFDPGIVGPQHNSDNTGNTGSSNTGSNNTPGNSARNNSAPRQGSNPGVNFNPNAIFDVNPGLNLNDYQEAG